MWYVDEPKDIGEKVQWLKMKSLRFEKLKHHIIQYKYHLNDSNFYEIDTTLSEKIRV